MLFDCHFCIFSKFCAYFSKIDFGMFALEEIDAQFCFQGFYLFGH